MIKNVWIRFSTLTVLNFLLIAGINGQTIVLDGTDISACSGIFTDSGGETAPYQANEDFTITICPDNGGSGSHVQLLFSEIDLGDGDQLCFYDGTTTAAPLLACSRDFIANEAFIVQASAANNSGCITLTFKSDATNQGQGWQASINCIQACQTILASLDQATPEVMPVDTGWIDICPGDVVRLRGKGEYPQNGTLYQHSDQNSNFTWNFGDGTEAVGPNVVHAFDEPGGYVVQLTIEDPRGCKNTNFISQRIRVAPKVSFEMGDNMPDEICLGDTVSLNGTVNRSAPSYTLSAGTNTGSFYQTPMRADSLALPDGVGTGYESTIEIRDFQPGQVVTDASDIEGICVNMEHSWMRDLEISLICPSGESIILHQFVDRTGSEVYIGEPIDTDGTNPIAGQGYDYCWTTDSDNNTWINYANRFFPQTIPAGDYNPFQSFDNLIGCPMNGEWTIKVQDLWARDNGYIFSWGIDFNPLLFPDLETFTPEITDLNWKANSEIISEQDALINAVPAAAGTASYSLEAIDEFGCVSDTVISFTVLPPSHPDCFDCSENIASLQDTVICEGESVQFDVRPEFQRYQELPFRANPNENFTFLGTSVIDPYVTTISVSGVSPANITDPTREIKSVCLNIETSETNDMDIFLVAPNGARLELSTDNGGNGDNFTNTCFTPTATRSVLNGTAPFSGDWRPEGNFNVFDGAPINGTWRIEVNDDDISGLFSSGNTFISWSITFEPGNNIDYQWDFALDLSCVDCSDPVARPVGTKTYYVEASDGTGCFHRDSVTVGVLRDFTPPDITCAVSDENEITFRWDEQPDVPAYEVEIFKNGNPDRVLVTSGTEFMAPNLNPLDEVRLDISPNGGETCFPANATATCINVPCDFEIDTVTTQTVSCFGLSDGTATVAISGGSGNFTYVWNDSLAQITPTAQRLKAGTYEVRVTDDTGCSARESVTVEEPEALSLAVEADNALCFAGNEGSAEAKVTGGTLPYNYDWSNGQQTAKAVDLAGGDYTVQVEDANGCIINGAANITEPDTPVSVTITQSKRGCAGVSDNELTATATGGEVEVYTFEWSNDQRTQTATGLDSIEYTVTVTDFNGCIVTSSFTPESKTPIDPNIIINLPNCNGTADGSIGVNFINGGGSSDIADYTFLWNTGATTPALENLAGGQMFTVTVTDMEGCFGVESRELGLPQAITFSADLVEPTCAGRTDGAISLTNILGGSGGYSFIWDANASNQTTAQASNLPAGTFMVTVSDAEGCEAFDTISLSEPTGMQITFSVQDNVCNGESIGAIIASVSGGTPGYSFTWPNGVADPQINSLPAGNYELSVADQQGCETTAIATVGEPPAIEADVSSQNVQCFGDQNGQIIITPLGGTAPYQYSIDNQSYGVNSAYNRLSAGTYPVYVRDAENCTSLVETVLLSEPAQLMADAGPDELTINLGDSLVLFADAINGTGNVSFTWKPSISTSISCTDCDQAWVRPFYSTNFELLAVDANGCKASDEILINVFKPRILTVPTGFSPNNDVNNDKLLVHGRSGTKVKLFQVFNRWGELLFEAENFDVNDETFGWDGKFRGQDVPSGVYLYYLVGQFLDGEEKIRKGQTTLIR